MENFTLEYNSDSLARVPRNVPLLLIIQCFFGGIRNKVIWFYLVFVLGVFFAVEGFECIENLIMFQGKKAYAKGTVTGFFSVNMEMDNKPVFGTKYIFHSNKGRQIIDTSYKAGTYFNKNHVVEVEYVEKNPTYSRLTGFSASKNGMLPLFIIFFPVVGFLGLIHGFKFGVKSVRLLKTGTMAKGVSILNPKKTSTTTNTCFRNLSKKTFKFIDYKNMEHTVTEDTNYFPELRYKKDVSILYDETDPDHAVIVECIPSPLIIDRNGYFNLQNNREKLHALGALIIPLCGIIINGFILY